MESTYLFGQQSSKRKEGWGTHKGEEGWIVILAVVQMLCLTATSLSLLFSPPTPTPN